MHPSQNSAPGGTQSRRSPVAGNINALKQRAESRCISSGQAVKSTKGEGVKECGPGSPADRGRRFLPSSIRVINTVRAGSAAQPRAMGSPTEWDTAHATFIKISVWAVFGFDEKEGGGCVPSQEIGAGSTKPFLTAPSCALSRKCSVTLGDCCVFQQRCNLLKKN